MRILIFFCCSLLLACSGQAQERQAVVLMYHHFGVDQHPSTNVRLQQFEAHLQYLDEAGYQVWSLAQVVEHLREHKPFPARVVAITVDDAYLSVYTEAYPRLRARGWPFTVFVATDGVDRHFQAYMDWPQMREMQQHGASFANHSASHDYLVRRRKGEDETQWAARMKADIQRAQRRLQQELGIAPLLFAYPFGEYDTALANIVAEMGYVAFGQHSGPVGLGADLRALPRFPMAESFAELDDFRLKVASLAFPLVRVSPWEPVVFTAEPPRMEVVLGATDADLSQLNCFYSAQGPMQIQWLDREAGYFGVQGQEALPSGRSRYNCTAPAAEAGRFYWYSHLWIRLEPPD